VTEVPRWVKGQSTGKWSVDDVPQKLKQNVTLFYTFEYSPVYKKNSGFIWGWG